MRTGKGFAFWLLSMFMTFCLTEASLAAISDELFVELCEKGTVQGIRIALSNGANPNARGGEYGRTALIAALDNNLEVLSILLEAGADVNAKDNEGKTPLDRAWYVHNEATIKVLEEAIGRNSVLEEAMVGNSPETLYQLGVKYATGDDVKADEKKGVELLRKAAEQGHEKAKDALKLFE